MIDYSVYLVTDRGLCLGRDLMDVVAAAVKGGVTLVQLREKKCGTREFVELARAMKKMLAPAKVPLLINDRVDVALACGADGVHVGQSDMRVEDVRALLSCGSVNNGSGNEKIVGLSVETEEHIQEARNLPVDYIGIGPVFPTQTKPDACSPWGLSGLKNARKRWQKPMVAIGSVNHDNATQIMACGMDGVAVVSAICSASDVEQAARQLSDLVRSEADH